MERGNNRPLKPCGHPGCRALVGDGTNRCEAHKPAAWARREDAPYRIRGSTLTRLREALFAAEPRCVACLAAGRVRLATVRDHIVPLSVAGVDLPTNEGCQGLCEECHSLKTEAERIAALRALR